MDGPRCDLVRPLPGGHLAGGITHMPQAVSAYNVEWMQFVISASSNNDAGSS